ncbi:MAG: 23S rRNA (uracil(1939)-C(5))-methyltransferase RlmD [Proteobacteria bacterium]|nr:23S rRNA (uracil(1939)-C(5))-methyltransferase RlmD [Pseudomonadota bacterium]
MKRGHSIEIEIESLSDEGLGVAYCDGLTLFIYGAVPRDRVVAVIEDISNHKPVAWCRVKEVVARGPGFAMPPCSRAAPVLGRCGGCPTMHMTPELQGELKHGRVTTALKEVGIVDDVGWHGATTRLAYRNRANFIPTRTDRGEIALGSFVPRSHDVVWMKDCKTVRSCIASIAGYLETVLSKNKVPIHPRPGGLRYVTLRGSPTGEVLVELVVNALPATWLDDVSAGLRSAESIVGISLSVNGSSGNAIRVAPSSSLFGRETIEEPVGPLILEMAAASFSQLNSDMTAQIYGAVANHIAKADVVWDLYCGLGGLGLTVAHLGKAADLYGADLAGASIELARNAAAREGAKAHFECFDLSERFSLPWPDPQVIIVNPPRRGLDRAVMVLLQKSPAKELVYMSCNPGSFARDARTLVEADFQLSQIDAYDMLPQTTHVELLGIFRKRGSEI